MSTHIKVLLTLALPILSAGLIGCGEAERTIDCFSICDKYSACYDASLDETECTDYCEDRGEEDAEFEAKIEACEECIDGLDCATVTAECSTECSGVVAASAPPASGDD